MPDTIPNLWPASIEVDVLTPLVILKAQAGLLPKITKGILEGKVTSVESEGTVAHQLDLIAPAYYWYQHRILTATHQEKLVYPVEVTAECFRVGGSVPKVNYTPFDRGEATASTQGEFLEIVATVLRSAEVSSVIQSLIARSNEKQQETSTKSPPSKPA